MHRPQMKMARFSFNGKPQATAFLSQASIQNAVACGLPLNEPIITVRSISVLSVKLIRRLERFDEVLVPLAAEVEESVADAFPGH